jgi:glycosyltransferase involved in cell wall biosynthesis
MKMEYSISMSVYEHDMPEYFSLAMKSIVEQSVAPNEIVLVIDGPIPSETENIISEFEKELEILKICRLAKNMGHGFARNYGIQNASHRLVALMDSDDIAVPDRFAKQLETFWKNPTIAVLGGQIEEFNDDDNHVVGRRIVPENHDEIINYMKFRCPFNQMTVMLDKEKVQLAGGYIDWFWNEDYYLWIRMFLKGYLFKNLDQTLVKVRVSENLYKRRGGWGYFVSESKLQNFMYENQIISLPIMAGNIFIRLIVQLLMPNKLREWVFKKMFRSNS